MKRQYKLLAAPILLISLYSVCSASGVSQIQFTHYRDFSPYISAMFSSQTYLSNEHTNWYGEANGTTHYHNGTSDAAGLIAAGVKKRIFNNGDIGAEIFAMTNPIYYHITSSSSIASANFTITQTLKNTWGLRLLPGYHLAPATEFYIPIGWARSQFNLSSGAPENVTSASHSLNGLQLGFGIEQAINNHLYLRLEYIHTGYQNFNVNYISSAQTKDRQYSLSTNQFNFGLTYYLLSDHVANSFSPALLSSGWYAGLGFGAATQTDKFTVSDTVNNFQQTQDSYGNGVVGELLAGYDHIFKNKFTLGAEAVALLDSSELHQSVELSDLTPLTRQGQINYGLSLSILPGYLIMPNFKLYGRAGYAASQYNFKTTQDITTNKTQFLNGLLLGLGGEFALSTHWSVRGEYQQTWYQSMKENIDTASEKIQPITHYYLVDGIYHF